MVLNKLLMAFQVVLSFFSINIENDYLVKQGNVTLTYKDINGYALTIPKKDRVGFFNSADRIDSTIKNLLNIKLLAKYSETSLQPIELNKTIEREISAYLLDNSDRLASENISDLEYFELKDYLKMVVKSELVKKELEKSVNSLDLTNFAYEKYLINKQSFYIEKELRDIDYFNIYYNEDNKEQQLKIVNDLIDSLKNNN